MSRRVRSNKFSQFLSLIRFWNPTGVFLLFIPCAIGVGLYGDIYHDYKLLLLFFVGSFVMRSAGCIANDFWDRDIDNKVARTKTRAITSGEISVKEAAFYFFLLCMIGLYILIQLSIEAILIGVLASIMMIVYPLMKRVTFWPQIFLGVTYNLGILIAVAHQIHEITPAAILTYIGGIFWTLYYDTIYAFMDREDDKKIGVKSTAIYLENKDYTMYLAFFAGMAVFFIMNGLMMASHNIAILFLGLIASIFLIMWQITTLKINLPENCLIRFKSNNYLGIIWVITALI